MVTTANTVLETTNNDQEPFFDLMVSNPPYVLRKDLAAVAPEISLYEDLRALDGGADGLDVILPIIQLADKVPVLWIRIQSDPEIFSRSRSGFICFGSRSWQKWVGSHSC